MFPEVQHWAQDALGFVQAHAHWTPYIAFLLAFGESLAVVSLFVPATVILIGMGPIIEAGGIALLPVWAGAAAGAALGDAVSYWVGFRLKGRARYIWPFSRHPQILVRGEHFFHRHGSWSVFIGRFFGPIRAVIPLVAGMFAMPQFVFQMANIASAMLWAFLLLAPGAAAVKFWTGG
ncbi:DedA family protein [Ancylobacter sp. MQZ15Z-1]|uniref:DedA family protein n=1 Tax=Ancylobacter mangrovi TaxID=2972472 RepID=A0A9X2PHT4_9HYPH|nr:DedA family protein [Ancylobacter mangrovi]MCS0494698.1 DedA family protein [Ancylobacter mangrovi]